VKTTKNKITTTRILHKKKTKNIQKTWSQSLPRLLSATSTGWYACSQVHL